eukprot:169187_1
MDHESAHGAIRSTTVNTTSWTEHKSQDIHHIDFVFIALVIGATISSLLMIVCAIQVKHKGLLSRTRGNSAVIEEIDVTQWASKPIYHEPEEVQRKEDKCNESSARTIDEESDTSDMYFDPKALTNATPHSITEMADGFALQTYMFLHRLMEGDEALPALPEGGEKIIDEYFWIETALKTIDGRDWTMYLNRFKQNKVTTQRLNTLIEEDFKELLPEIGVRRDFINLIKQNASTQQHYHE